MRFHWCFCSTIQRGQGTQRSFCHQTFVALDHPDKWEHAWTNRTIICAQEKCQNQNKILLSDPGIYSTLHSTNMAEGFIYKKISWALQDGLMFSFAWPGRVNKEILFACYTGDTTTSLKSTIFTSENKDKDSTAKHEGNVTRTAALRVYTSLHLSTHVTTQVWQLYVNVTVWMLFHHN